MSAPMQLDLIIPGEHDIEIVDPDTGEQVALADASSETIAAVLRVIQERLADWSQKKRWLGGVLIERMDANAEWTVRGARVKITAPSATDTKIEWDAEALTAALDDLVTEGVITREAALRACEQRVEYRPLLRGIQAIQKIPGVAERIQHASTTVPTSERTVRVSVTS